MYPTLVLSLFSISVLYCLTTFGLYYDAKFVFLDFFSKYSIKYKLVISCFLKQKLIETRFIASFVIDHMLCCMGRSRD